jgi:hypothetical protein
MVYFQTKYPNWGVLDWTMLIYIFDHLEYFKDIWDILWPFGTFCVDLVHFFRFWYHVPRQIWQPCWKVEQSFLPTHTVRDVYTRNKKYRPVVCKELNAVLFWSNLDIFSIVFYSNPEIVIKFEQVAITLDRSNTCRLAAMSVSNCRLFELLDRFSDIYVKSSSCDNYFEKNVHSSTTWYTKVRSAYFVQSFVPRSPML